MTPFDYVNSINDKKQKLDPENAEYIPFLINRAFSLYKDTIFHANELNQYPDLPKSMQYEYYYNIIPKRSRWAKWSKKISTKDIENLMEYYSYSYKKASEVVKAHTKEQLKAIEKSLVKE